MDTFHRPNLTKTTTVCRNPQHLVVFTEQTTQRTTRSSFPTTTAFMPENTMGISENHLQRVGLNNNGARARSETFPTTKWNKQQTGLPDNPTLVVYEQHNKEDCTSTSSQQPQTSCLKLQWEFSGRPFTTKEARTTMKPELEWILSNRTN